MSDGMGREFTYLSSHATNRYFIPNWGIIFQSHFPITQWSERYSQLIFIIPNTVHRSPYIN